jgi:Fe-S-cluster-containing dehydrogenase component
MLEGPDGLGEPLAGEPGVEALPEEPRVAQAPAFVAPRVAEALAAEPPAADASARGTAGVKRTAKPATPAAEAPQDAVLVSLEAIAPAIEQASLTRRAFLGFGLALAGGVAGAAALGQLFPVFASAEDQVSPLVPSYDPKSKAWTFVVDTARCIGCGLCVVACKEENNVPESAEFTRTWVERHTTMTDGTRFVDSPDAGINGFPVGCTAPGAEGKTAASSFFQPRLCMQCEDSPCTAVCPVSATYRTEDGIILVDARRCIGCGFCVVSCPYGARYITPADEDSPANTPGVADKCTWCYHRINRGQQPACVEICPVGARRFGDANDPSSDIAQYTIGGQPLHPEYGTRPRVAYLGPTLGEA